MAESSKPLVKRKRAKATEEVGFTIPLCCTCVDTRTLQEDLSQKLAGKLVWQAIVRLLVETFLTCSRCKASSCQRCEESCQEGEDIRDAEVGQEAEGSQVSESTTAGLISSHTVTLG